MMRFLQNLFRKQASGTKQRFSLGGRRRHRHRRPQKSAGRPKTPQVKLPTQKAQPSPGWFFSRSKQSRISDSRLQKGELLAWHGTPGLPNVKSILTHGWVVGNGNAVGDGVYSSSDFGVAKGYAGSSGYVLKLALKPGRMATWSTSLQRRFAKWCSLHNCTSDMSAKTAFLLTQGFQTLREGNVFVVLLRAYRNPLAAKIRTRRIRIIGAVRASDGQEINLSSLQNG